MNCHDFEENVLALARNQLLEAAIREESLIHVNRCTQCSRRLAEEKVIIAGVRAVVAEIAKEEAPTRVEAILLTAFREQFKAEVSGAGIPPTWPRIVESAWWLGWRLPAVAAGILILISALAIFWQRSNLLDEVSEARTTVPGISDRPDARLPLPITQVREPIGPAPHSGPPRAQGRRRNIGNDDETEVEIVSLFFPLREGEDLALLENLELVRVELPRSALSEMGLMLSPDAPHEPIKADVLLGEDGMARAIRFVR